MSRVRLYFEDNDKKQLIQKNGLQLSLTFLRLTTMVRFAQINRTYDGLIDTGSAFSIFPDAVWQPFEEAIEWFHFPEGSNPPSWWSTASGLTGGAFTCRIGRISLSILDFEKNAMNDVPVIGKFLNDGGKLRERVIFGLAHGILHHRIITINSDAREAWLEDRA